MTSEEAKKQIIKLQHQIYKNWGGDIELEADEHYEALDEAIDAIEKQIPKKPAEMKVDEYCVDWVCQKCERFHRTEWKMAFCSSCGQAIKWGKNEKHK